MEKKEAKQEDHEELETLDIHKFFNVGQEEKKHEETSVPKKKNIFFLVILTIITLGIYPAVWYLKRASEFNNLGTKKKMKKALPKILLFIDIITLVALGMFAAEVSSEDLGTFYQNAGPLLTALVIIVIAGVILRLILSLILAFYSRAIINEAIKYNKNIQKKISWFFTLIFCFLYLQYEVNRIEKDEEEKPIKAPWVILIIILLGIAGLIAYLMM